MNKIVSWFCKIFLKPIVDKILIKEVRGWENIPQPRSRASSLRGKRNFILVSNHTSYLDIIVNGYLCLPRKFHFIGQIDGWKGVAKWLIRGFYFFSGVIPLDRKSEKSRENALRKGIEVLKKGNILILYPEGRRSETGEIQEGKLGVAKFFLKTEVPILPTAIKGTFELMPPQGKLKIKRMVKVNIGKPLFFEKELVQAKNLDENSQEYNKILQEITAKIMAEISKLATDDND